MKTVLSNDDVADLLTETADLMEVCGENDFKIRAFRSAARVVEKHPRSVFDEEDLTALAGVGKSLAIEIGEMGATGASRHLLELRARLPEGFSSLLRVAGLGPKKVRVLWENLGVGSLGELEYACAENRLVTLPGFGEKSQEKTLSGVRFLASNQGRFLLSQALPAAGELAAFLGGCSGVEGCAVAGEVRRRREVVTGAEVVVAVPASHWESLGERLASHPQVAEVSASGDSLLRLRLRSQLPMDLHRADPAAFVAALVCRTGSTEHVACLENRAKSMGFFLSERGLMRGDGAPWPLPDEESLYARLGLPFLPAELREGAGDPEVSDLLEETDLHGVLHNHTTWSDGSASVQAMAEAARAMGLGYLSISDHSRVAVYAHGLDEERLRAQGEEIREVEARMGGGFRILRSIEVDILSDGSLDLPDGILGELDVVVASVHSAMSQSREDMTRRLLKAVNHPLVSVLGHPTGRLLLGRPGYSFDEEAVWEAAAQAGTILEINANPHRLDLAAEKVRAAAARGARFAISPDAHSLAGLEDTSYGVGVARRAGLSRGQVVNTLPAGELLEVCRGKGRG